jgi:hypothetical protein
MKTIFKTFTVLFIILISVKAKGQVNNSPKNFPEVFAGIEWNSLSGLRGISYEGYIFQTEKWVIGAKASHAFTYKLGNASLFGTNGKETASFNSIASTAHKFFQPDNRGIFLCSELGMGSRKNKSYDVEYSTLFTAFEAGFGVQFRAGNKFAIRWTNTLTFAGNAGITMTKLSIGF